MVHTSRWGQHAGAPSSHHSYRQLQSVSPVVSPAALLLYAQAEGITAVLSSRARSKPACCATHLESDQWEYLPSRWQSGYPNHTGNRVVTYVQPCQITHELQTVDGIGCSPAAAAALEVCEVHPAVPIVALKKPLIGQGGCKATAQQYR